jgi:2-phospho-L-lactate guanylyltransferase
MSLWAIVPIKPLRRGKSRLSAVLSESEREKLNQSLLIKTISCLKEIKEIDQILVVSYDPNALNISRDFGARTIQESHNTNINKALRKGSIAAHTFNVSSVLIIPADLPYINADAIRQLLGKAGKPPEIVITPDRRMNGTNALYINPVGILDYDYGMWSFRKHVEQAERKKIRVEIYNNDTLSFDLDIPEDLEFLKQNDNNNSEFKLSINHLEE